MAEKSDGDTGKQKELYEKLSAKFHPDNVEWVIVNARDYNTRNGKLIKAYAQPYIKKESAEARMDRVVGTENWENNFSMPDERGRIKYQLRFRHPGAGADTQWITKRSGSSVDLDAKGNFANEAFEIALTYAEKRVFAKIGIGRYLKLIPPIQVEISDSYKDGWNYYSFKSSYEKQTYKGKKVPKRVTFYWRPPPLPQAALPEGVEQSQPASAPPDEKPPTKKERSEATKSQWETLIAYWDNMPESEKQTWQQYLFLEEVDDDSGEVKATERRRITEQFANELISSLKKGYGKLNEDGLPAAFASTKKAEKDFDPPPGNPDDEQVKKARQAASEKK